MKFEKLHPWNVSLEEAANIQRELQGWVSLVDEFGEIRLVAGVDVSIPHGTDIARAAVVVLSYPDFGLVEVQRASRTLEFPYIPGFLSFREAPAILEASEKIENVPDMIIVDGQESTTQSNWLVDS